MKVSKEAMEWASGLPEPPSLDAKDGVSLEQFKRDVQYYRRTGQHSERVKKLLAEVKKRAG